MRNGTTNQIVEVLFFRHGATEGNLEHRYIGRTDEPLSQSGRAQLVRSGSDKAQLLFTSPMTRCIQTAELLFPGQQPHCIEEWREMDFGQFEGKNYEELKDVAEYQRWIDSNGTLPFPGGESRAEFVARVKCGMNRMIKSVTDDKKAFEQIKTIACVVHGGTIMAVLSEDSGEDYFSFQCKNGEGYRCIYELEDGKRKLVSYEKIERTGERERRNEMA